MDIEIVNAVLHLRKWEEVKGYQAALKESVELIEKIVDDRSKERLEDYVDSRKGN